MWKYIALFGIIFCSSLAAGTIDPNTPDKDYISYGKDFKYTGKLYGKNNKGVGYYGSAVAINDHWIITAGHVVEDSTSSCIFDIGNKFVLDKIIVHPDFDKTKLGIADLAICHSKESFGLSFYPDIYDKNDEIGKVCSMSGYGRTGNFNTGAVKYDDKLRAGSNTIDGIDRMMLLCSPSKRYSADYTSLEFLIATGDSGGGLFIDGKLAGIHSCVLALDKNPDSTYGDESGHTRLSLFRKWIISNVSE